MGHRAAVDWEGARAPAGRRPGPRTPRRRKAASVPTAAAPRDLGQTQLPGALGGTRRPPPPQRRYPPGPPTPGSAREPWLPAEPPCAPFPSGDLGARKTGQGRKGEENRDGDGTPASEGHEEREDRNPHNGDPEKEGTDGGGGRPQREGKDPERRGDRGSEGERPIEKGQRRGRQRQEGQKLIKRGGRRCRDRWGQRPSKGRRQKGDGSSDRGRWRIGQVREKKK